MRLPVTSLLPLLVVVLLLDVTAVTSTFIPTDSTQQTRGVRLDKRTKRAAKMDAKTFADTEFTHLIVGGGTAGLALAGRLSEVQSYTVGVLEAGPSGVGDPINDIPGMFGANLASKYNWNLTTTTSESGAPAIAWPRGKVLGGSSVLNFLVWDRSASVEYDAWEQLGNPGWNWKNLYKYLKKSEEFHTPSADDAKKLHIQPNAANYGDKGPIQVSYPRYISEQVQRWIPALQNLGIQRNNEPLAGKNVGASVQPSNINPNNSTRSYSTAYVIPHEQRKNLHIVTEATVSKIVLEKSGAEQKATAVEFYVNGQKYTVKTSNQVIVSAGSVHTPQILELSGIGAKSVLDKAGVKQLVDLPGVGENLQDHTYTSAAYEIKEGIATLDSLRNNETFAAQQQKAYQSNQTSILDETVPSIAYLSLKELVGDEKAAQLQSEAKDYVNKSTSTYKYVLEKQLDFLTKYPDTVGQMEMIAIDGYFATSGAPETNKNYVTFLAAQQHLLSRGHVHINSSDVNTAPVISPNYFDAPFDLDISTAGTEYMRKIANSSAYADDYITKEVLPATWTSKTTRSRPLPPNTTPSAQRRCSPAPRAASLTPRSRSTARATSVSSTPRSSPST
ncbi:hypothetical protein L7F22_036882 [Adiantum nelumboides]|nr:hypothetical protein [Adiantum nelumboides]